MFAGNQIQVNFECSKSKFFLSTKSVHLTRTIYKNNQRKQKVGLKCVPYARQKQTDVKLMPALVQIDTVVGNCRPLFERFSFSIQRQRSTVHTFQMYFSMGIPQKKR